MGLLDLDLVVRVGFFPEIDEFCVVILIQLAGRIVGHVEQFVILGDSRACENSTGESSQRKTANGHRLKLLEMLCVGFFDFFLARQNGIRTGALLFFRGVSGVRMKPSG